MADVSIRATAITSAPMDYKVPGSQEIAPKSVTASMDGTGAASAWFPCLQLLDPAGNVMFSAIAQQSVAAGGLADISWFPHVGGATSAGSVSVVGARIEAHVAQSVTTATTTDLVYDTVAFDTSGMANLGSDARKLTVATAGLYLVICETIWDYNNAGHRLNVLTQNSFYASGGAAIAADSGPAVWASPVGGSGGAPHSNNISVTLAHAVAGDFFASGAQQDSGGALNANGLASGSNQDNFLSAILLGTT